MPPLTRQSSLDETASSSDLLSAADYDDEDDVAPEPQLKAAQRVLRLTAIYQDIEDLVSIGAYVPGRSVEHDLAVGSRERIVAYLQQDSRAPITMEQAARQLHELDAWIEQSEKVLRAQANAAKLPRKQGGL